MSYPKVTIVVVPNECFNFTQKSLQSIYRYTDIPFKLIYIDGYSPKKIKEYLEVQSQEKGFRLIRTEKYLSPNQARNIGLKYVDTKYVVFLNNDTLVTDGWLNSLIECAEETQASVVSPVSLQKTSENLLIRSAGGTLEFQYKDGTLDLLDRKLFSKKPFQEVQSFLTRKPTQIIDFNCVLVQKSIFSKIGCFDEKLISFAQEIDFSLCVFSCGGTIYLEPDSMVKYLPAAELKLSDIPYNLLICNYVWKCKSINHFQEKWGLTKDATFITRVLEQVNQRTTLPIKSLKEVIKPFYFKEGTYVNSQIIEGS